MKKKGLIISTVVMAVVLIASLTTATYAWFTASASTDVDSISIKVAATSDVFIGLHSGTTNTQDDYMYGNVTCTPGGSGSENTVVYSDGELGLSNILHPSIADITLNTAVGTYATATSTFDSTWTIANPIYKANASASSDTAVDPETVAVASADVDYIKLDMGAMAAREGVKGIWCQIKVTTKDTGNTMKMNAAFHMYIDVNGEVLEFEPFGSACKENSSKSAAGTGWAPATGVTLSYDTSTSQVTSTINFLVAGEDAYVSTATDLKSDGTQIFPFTVYAYIFGPDQNCVSTATGTDVAFDISFFGVTAANAAKTTGTVGAIPTAYLPLA